MATFKLLFWPPPQHANWFGYGTVQRNEPEERVIAQRAFKGNQIKHNKPRTIPFPCQPENSPGPFCPMPVPFPAVVRGLADAWKNSLTPAQRQLWQGKACEIGQDRPDKHTPTRNGWCAFLTSGFYSLWYRQDCGHLFIDEDLPLTDLLGLVTAHYLDQWISITVSYPNDDPPKYGNVLHNFQIDPKRLNSNVPWQFTRGIGQFSNWDPEESFYQYWLKPAWPIHQGDKVGVYVRESTGQTSWRRYTGFTTAL